MFVRRLPLEVDIFVGPLCVTGACPLLKAFDRGNLEFGFLICIIEKHKVPSLTPETMVVFRTNKGVFQTIAEFKGLLGVKGNC
jgi:hypothetical protein